MSIPTTYIIDSHVLSRIPGADDFAPVGMLNHGQFTAALRSALNNGRIGDYCPAAPAAEVLGAYHIIDTGNANRPGTGLPYGAGAPEPEVSIAFISVTTPAGGSEYRPMGRFSRIPPDGIARYFIRTAAKKPNYVRVFPELDGLTVNGTAVPVGIVRPRPAHGAAPPRIINAVTEALASIHAAPVTPVAPAPVAPPVAPVAPVAPVTPPVAAAPTSTPLIPHYRVPGKRGRFTYLPADSTTPATAPLFVRPAGQRWRPLADADRTGA